MRTGRITAAEIALDHFVVLLIKQRTSKRTSRYTRHTTYADLMINLIGSCGRIELDRVYEA